MAGIETEADRLAFLDPSDFGIEAILTLADGRKRTISGIFTNRYLESAVAQFVGIDARERGFLTTTREAQDATREDTIEIEDVVHDIAGLEPDGQGMTFIKLKN